MRSISLSASVQGLCEEIEKSEEVSSSLDGYCTLLSEESLSSTFVCIISRHLRLAASGLRRELKYFVETSCHSFSPCFAKAARNFLISAGFQECLVTLREADLD